MIKFFLGGVLILMGLIVVVTALIGNFKFGYVLNRMQAGATADTLGTGLIILGLIIISGFNVTSVKLVVLVLFLWIANPVQSHFLARTEIISNEGILEECEVIEDGNI